MRTPLVAMRYLLSVEREPRLEVRLLQLLSLVSTFIAVLTLPFNLLEHLSIYHDLTVLMLGVASLGLFMASMKGHHAFNLFTLGVVVVLNVCWFADGGSLSSICTFFFLAIMAMCIFFRGWQRWAIIGLFLMDLALLFSLDYLHPQWIIPFKSPADRFLETFSGSAISLVTCMLVMLVLITSYDAEQKKLAESNHHLQQTLEEIHTLQGLLPICAWCKKVRDDEGLWTQVEQYIAERTDLAFTHGLCPNCAQDQKQRFKENLPSIEELQAGAGSGNLHAMPPI